MYKLVTFAGYDNQTGPHIFPIEADVGRSLEHIKMARPLPASIEQYIATAKPVPGKTSPLTFPCSADNTPRPHFFSPIVAPVGYAIVAA